jgi:heavy-metal resistance protein
MRTLTSWLLAGALAASLTWNWTLQRTSGAAGVAPEVDAAADATCTSSASCSLGGEELGLDPDVRAALDALCARTCAESDRLERRANELQDQLLASLSAPTVDEAATAKLVAEVAELRRQSLASCVAGILGVRQVLSPEQVKTLLARCEHGAASCR